MFFSNTGSKIKLFLLFELILFSSIFDNKTKEAVCKVIVAHSLKYRFKNRLFAFLF